MSAGAGVATANAPDASLAYRAAKRAFDIVFSLLVIVVGTVPGLLLALATVVSTGGSPLFVQERVGNKGAFPCIKMRTMRAGGGS